MPFVKVTANANSGNWTQLSTVTDTQKNVTCSNTVACDWVLVSGSGTAADEFAANRVFYTSGAAITTFTNVSPSWIWMRANAASAGNAFGRWE